MTFWAVMHGIIPVPVIDKQHMTILLGLLTADEGLIQDKLMICTAAFWPETILTLMQKGCVLQPHCRLVHPPQYLASQTRGGPVLSWHL
jgi:hypothetical protein